ncbi:MAG: hypothetical protein J6C33_06245 [Lachnospiraceae bacterium]|nr:hypothetical protein [Lachnospiraceae bacterium]
MKQENDRIVCPECGYYHRINAGKYASARSVFPEASESAAAKPASAETNRKTAPAGPLPDFKTVSAGVPRKAGDPVKTSPVAVISVIATFLAIGVSVVSALIPVFRLPASTVQDASSFEAYDTETQGALSSRLLPESEFFQAISAQMFEKDFGEITQGDLGSVTELRLFYDADGRRCFSYVLSNGTEASFYAPQDAYADMSDLGCFRNVTSLTLEYGSAFSDDITALTQLTNIASELSLDDLAEGISCPEKIRSITIYRSVFMDSFDGAASFPNLTSLSADCSYVQDISGLASLSGLQELSIASGDYIEDFSPLYDLSFLQSLAIDSETLDDIGFVESMPELTFLSIEDSKSLQSIDALAACRDTLKCLYFDDTWELSDYSVIEQLPNLTDLGLCVSYDTPLPDFSGLLQLNALNLYGAGDISALSEAKNLSMLSLDSCNCEDLSVLSGMQNLTYLALCNMSGYYVSFEPVLSLPNLQILDISGSTVYENAQPLLGIPTLTAFYMQDCCIGFDMTNVPVNESLSVLDMSRVTLYPLEDGGDYGWLQDKEELSLAQHTGLFSSFPNLTELSLSGNHLNSLSFFEEGSFHQLGVLDISDNDITDLSPLSGLESLYRVNCENNPIADTAGLDAILLN